MKMHIKDIRLFNNAGMSFPVCQAGAKLLDLDKTAWKTGTEDEATCKRCMRAYAKRYGWAMDATTQEHFDKHLKGEDSVQREG